MTGLESALAVVGVGLAIPGVIDLCLKYGEIMVNKVELYRHAEKTLSEKQLRIQDHWIKIKTEIQFLSSVSSKLSPDIVFHFNQLLQQLLGRLDAAIRLLDSIHAKPNWRAKVKLTFSGIKSIQRVVGQLDEWQGCFSNYLLLITLVRDPTIDTLLTVQTLNGSQSLKQIQRIRTALNMPVSKKLLLALDENPKYTQRSLLEDSGNEIWITPDYIVEYKGYIPISALNETPAAAAAQIDAFHSDICNLAQVLSASDPSSMNILQCHGFSHNRAKKHFELFYNLPAGQTAPPRTLRNILLSPENKLGAFHPINHRFKLASQLAQAVLYVHSAKLVHKNIRPETILITEPAGADKTHQYPRAIGMPFLVGFSKVRNIQVASERTGDQDWEKNIYRHPERQGLHPEQKYSILHDIYSLGVCLLEISLWQSFVVWDAPRREYKNNKLVCALIQKGVAGPMRGKERLKSPVEIQAAFVRKAQQVVPRIMGDKFTAIVVSCLTCLEGGLGDKEDLMDENGVVSGVAYVSRVLQMFEEISL